MVKDIKGTKISEELSDSKIFGVSEEGVEEIILRKEKQEYKTPKVSKEKEKL